MINREKLKLIEDLEKILDLEFESLRSELHYTLPQNHDILKEMDKLKNLIQMEIQKVENSIV